MQVVEPAWHEVTLNANFNDHGLAPYFAADSRVKDGGGAQNAEFTHQGERWEATLYHQDSGLVHPGDRTPGGTEFRLETIREFRIAVDRHEGEDPHGLQGFNAHLRPRWDGQETRLDSETTKDVSVPEGFGDGVNVRLAGSNVEAQQYLPLLREAAEAVGINYWYFDDPHESSNVQDAERYVRVEDGRSGGVHARDGPIAQLSHLLENDRDGYRKVVQNDRDNDGRNVPGWYHTVTLGPKRVQEAFPDHRYPREIKHYKSRKAESLDSSHPLAHPKVGASYQVSRWGETLFLDELDDLERELDQTVHSVLADAGIQVHDGPDGPFRSDDCFQPENVERPEDWLYGLDLAHVRQEQESIVIRTIEDGGFSPIQWDALERLIADGGKVAPKQIADDFDWHPDAVRKALRKMEELLDREYGEVALRSSFVAEMVYDAVQDAREAVRGAVGSFAKAVEAGKRGLDETTSAFIAWAQRYDVDVNDASGARMKLRMEGVENVERQIQKGYQLWKDAGRDLEQFRDGTVILRRGGETQYAMAGSYLR